MSNVGRKGKRRLEEISLSPRQCRAARAAIGWPREALAEASNVSRVTIADFELGNRKPMVNNLLAIRSVLEAAGIVFTRDDDSGREGITFPSTSEGV